MLAAKIIFTAGWLALSVVLLLLHWREPPVNKSLTHWIVWSFRIAGPCSFQLNSSFSNLPLIQLGKSL